MSQSLKKQKTIDLDSMPTWGKLVPLTMGISGYQMKQFVVIIGRNAQCSIQINDKRLSGKHCRIEKKEEEVCLIDLSTNGTFIKDAKIGKGNQVTLQNNSQIWLLPASKVKPSQTLGFRFELETDKTQKVEKQQLEKKEQQEKVTPTPKDDLSQSIKDQITCSFCFQIMFQPVSVQPCNHRFCGACLTELVQNKKDTCIQCRKPLTTAAKDSMFNSIAEDYLKSHPEQKRDPNEIEKMTKKNIFGFDPLDIQSIIKGKIPKKTKVEPPASRRGRGRSSLAIRASSDLSASDDDQQRCRECMNMRNGFQCGHGQRHTPCMNCGKLIANRDDKSLHQNCVLCTNFYCNLYYPPCKKTGIKLKLLRNRRGQKKIDTELLRSNRFQFEALRDFLSRKGRNSESVFDYVLDKMDKDEFSYIIDRKIMINPPLASRQIKLNPDDAVCDTCYRDVWFQMVFYYRTLVNSQMPKQIKDRPGCYWGINCRTMTHNADHAKRYNHVQFQTKF